MMRMSSMMKLLIFCHWFLMVSGGWNQIRTKTPPITQAKEVAGILNRLIPSHADRFIIKIQSQQTNFMDSVTLVSKKQYDQTYIEVVATTGVAASWGIHHYLKYYCQVHVSWNLAQLKLHDLLPEVNISLNAVDRFRYHQNACVYSYTFAFWQWAEWENHIDWMALNGINLPLAMTAQEEIWRRVYTKLGVSEDELESHFAGPAFLAWGRMGNLNSWGGPLWPGWHEFTVDLQHKILSRMRGLGMTPILPAFAGHVPKGIIDLYKPNYTEQYWEGFGPTYLLKFSDHLFEQIGFMFIKEYQAEFGPTDHLYTCDSFNEMIPETDDPTFVATSGKIIYRAMTMADPDAVWVMQGWIFYSESEYWHLPQIEALLTSVPIGKMIILDLYSTHAEQYTRTKSYFGQAFIFNDLSNFGGNSALFGTIDKVNKGPSNSRLQTNGSQSSMVGTGFAMEGLALTYPTVDLLSEMSWRQNPVEDLGVWFDNYTTRRYGGNNPMASQAWKTLIPGVLNSTLKKTYTVVTRLPDLYMKHNLGYNSEDVNLAWDYIILAVKKNPRLALQETFRYDLVDITRQSLVNLASKYHNLTLESFFRRDYKTFQDRANNFLILFRDLEQLLRSEKHFLLGPWIKAAKSLGKTKEEKARLEYNARRQITLWGPKGSLLDYSFKHWSGLMQDYYFQRWILFYKELGSTLVFGHLFDKHKFKEKFFKQIGIPFIRSKKVYPTKSKGDSVKISICLHGHYRQTTNQS